MDYLFLWFSLDNAWHLNAEIREAFPRLMLGSLKTVVKNCNENQSDLWGMAPAHFIRSFWNNRPCVEVSMNEWNISGCLLDRHMHLKCFQSKSSHGWNCSRASSSKVLFDFNQFCRIVKQDCQWTEQIHQYPHHLVYDSWNTESLHMDHSSPDSSLQYLHRIVHVYAGIDGKVNLCYHIFQFIQCFSWETCIVFHGK